MLLKPPQPILIDQSLPTYTFVYSQIVQNRAEKGDNIKANLKELLDIGKEFLERIYTSDGLFSE